MSLGDSVAPRDGLFDGDVERGLRLAQLSGLGQSHAELGQEKPPLGVGFGQELARALEQIDSGRQVVTRERCSTRSAQVLSTAPRELEIALPCRRLDLHVVAECLFEVVAGHFRVLVAESTRSALEPARMLLMQGGATLLRNQGVRCVPDQDVAEAEALLALDVRAYGTDQLAMDQRGELDIEIAWQGNAKRFRHGPAMEGPALDRGDLQHGARPRIEAIDACRQHRLDRRWNSPPPSPASLRMATNWWRKNGLPSAALSNCGLVSGRKAEISLELFEQLAGVRR